MTEHHRSTRSLRRSVGLTAAGAMALAAMPAGVAAAQDDPAEPRGIDLVCDGENDSDFDDVDDDNVHVEAILCAADYGIAAGYDADTYGPYDDVRRDQMASFIARWVEDATGEELDEGDQDFGDVEADNVHREAIRKLTNAEIALGFDDDTYGPDLNIERDQMASFIARALSYIDDGDAANASAPPASDQDYFTDVDAEDNVHAPAINALAQQGVVAGYDDDTYGPDDHVQRDQMASFIMRGYDYAVEAGLVTPAPAVEVSIEAPTTDTPATAEAGGELDVTFTTSEQCDYSLDIRPTGAADPDEWVILDQGVTDEGEATVAVTLPDDADVGDWDLRATCVTEDDATSVVAEAAIEVVASDDT